MAASTASSGEIGTDVGMTAVGLETNVALPETQLTLRTPHAKTRGSNDLLNTLLFSLPKHIISLFQSPVICDVFSSTIAAGVLTTY
jgi:hypothetical protein